MPRRYRELPELIHDWLLSYDAWLVGSSVGWVQGKGSSREPPRDYDVVICDPNDFHAALRGISPQEYEEFELNTMGGLKITTVQGEEIDVWTQSVDDYTNIATSMGYDEPRLLSLKPRRVLECKVD
jgi:hypothetical protein